MTEHKKEESSLEQARRNGGEWGKAPVHAPDATTERKIGHEYVPVEQAKIEARFSCGLSSNDAEQNLKRAKELDAQMCGLRMGNPLLSPGYIKNEKLNSDQIPGEIKQSIIAIYYALLLAGKCPDKLKNQRGSNKVVSPLTLNVEDRDIILKEFLNKQTVDGAIFEFEKHHLESAG
jgi:hypothetical protein